MASAKPPDATGVITDVFWHRPPGFSPGFYGVFDGVFSAGALAVFFAVFPGLAFFANCAGARVMPGPGLCRNRQRSVSPRPYPPLQGL